jgi:hypothetical protein
MDKRIQILSEIAADMEKDAAKFDGKPFTGKTVAEYIGCQGAAIAALADIVRSILEENKLGLE